MGVSWAWGCSHEVLSRADTSVSISREGEAVCPPGEKPPNGLTAQNGPPRFEPRPLQHSLSMVPGRLWPWPWQSPSVHWNLVSIGLYEVTEVENQSSLHPHPQPLIPRLPTHRSWHSLLLPGAACQPHLLFPGARRWRGPDWGLEELHFPFNDSLLGPQLAQVKVKGEFVLVFLLAPFLWLPGFQQSLWWLP